MGGMKAINRSLKLPALFCAGSFLCILVLFTATSPVKQISYAVVFFITLFIFLVSAGYLIATLQSGRVTPKSRYRIVIVSLSILILLMFRSAQSLSWVDLMILALVTGGFLFYSNRRSF